MGHFDELLKEQEHSDRERLENAYQSLEDTLGSHKKIIYRSSDRSQDRAYALKEICDYFGYDAPEFKPDRLNNDEYLSSILRQNGVKTRNCELRGDWHRDVFGVYLCELENGQITALLPDRKDRYYYNDREKGIRVMVNGSSLKNFTGNAVLYYIPMPVGVLTQKDMLFYMEKTLSRTDRRKAVLLAMEVSLIGLLLPVVNNLMFSMVIPSTMDEMVLSLTFFLLSSMIAKYLFTVVRTMAVQRITQKMTVMLQSALFSRVLDLPASFFRKYSTGDIYGALNLVEQLCTIWCTVCYSGVLTLLFSGVYVLQLFFGASQMILPALLVIGIELLIQILGIFGLSKNTDDRLRSQISSNAVALDTLSGVEQIKICGAQNRAFARWMEIYRDQAEAEYRPPFVVKLQKALMPAIGILGMLVLFYYAKRFGLSSGTFVYFYSAYGLANAAILGMTDLGGQIACIRPITRLIEPILAEKPEIAPDGREPGRLSGRIVLDHVRFRYGKNSRPVIDDLSMSIERGEYVAIVGSSGSGKSTLVRLLLGFEQPQQGGIYYDGENLNHMDQVAVRRQIGTVLQNGKLFTGNIFMNIAISAPDLTEEEAWEAAEMAGIADDIRAMPLGMFTIISEGAGGLSGGQKQRILIARVIAQNPSILILDEATSALDNISQKKATDALSKLRCTRIVIAHRLSTIRDCDRILVLNEGKIVESGTYDELLKLGGEFANLVRKQLLSNK